MIKATKLLWIVVQLLVFEIALFGQQSPARVIDLNNLIDAAVTNNPAIKGGQLNVEITNNDIQIKKAELLPQISANATYGLSDENSLRNNYSFFRSGINVSQNLWKKGKYNSLVRQSKFIYQAKQSEFEAQKLDLILQVKFSYYNLLRYRKLYEISENNIFQAELYLDAAKEKNKLGVGKYSDILKAESDLADAKFLAKNYSYSLKESEIELSRLTGLPVIAESIPQNTILVGSNRLNVLERDSLLELAKISYPELQVIENIGLSQEYLISATKADLFPAVTANTGYSWLYNPVFSGQPTWYAGVAISWDVFDGKRRKNQVKTEMLRSQSYQYQKEDLLLELVKEIENILNAFNEVKNQIEISEILMKSTVENLKMLEEEYKQGISSMLELTIARTDDFNANAKHINAITDYELVKAQLERIIGVTSLNN
ncbi:MAG: TolC family protein [Bacteroidota bacterium]